MAGLCVFAAFFRYGENGWAVGEEGNGSLGMKSGGNDFIIYVFLFCRYFLTQCLVFLIPERTVWKAF